MTYEDALLEAISALEVRRRWYGRRMRKTWEGAKLRRRHVERALERLDELLEAARSAGI